MKSERCDGELSDFAGGLRCVKSKRQHNSGSRYHCWHDAERDITVTWRESKRVRCYERKGER